MARVYVGNLSWGVKWQDLKDHMARAGQVEHADVFEDSTGRSKGCGIVEYASVEDSQKAIKELNDTELFGRLIFVREDREEAGAGAGASRGRGRGGSRGGGGRGRGGHSGGEEVQHEEGGNYEGGYGGRGRGRGGFRGGRGRGGYNGGGGGYEGGRGGYEGEYQAPAQFNRPPPSRPEDHGRQVFVSNLPWKCSWQDLKDFFKESGEVIRADVLHFPDGRSRGAGTVLFATPEAAQACVDTMNDKDFQGRPVAVKLDKYV